MHAYKHTYGQTDSYTNVLCTYVRSYTHTQIDMYIQHNRIFTLHKYQTRKPILTVNKYIKQTILFFSDGYKKNGLFDFINILTCTYLHCTEDL